MTKVLMLGWEFPPLFSGGLGVATYGIVKSLSPKTQIKLIIPAVGTSSILSDINIIELNHITSDIINLERLQFSLSSTHAEVITLPIGVSPYHHINAEMEREGFDAHDVLKQSRTSLDIVNDIFSNPELYGSNIMHKIYLFTKLAEEIASDGNFDVIHAHDWVTFSAGLAIKKRTGRPLVLHVHSLETDRAEHATRNEIYRLEKDAMIEADKVIAVSHYTRGQIIQHYQIDPSKISVVHNGIEPAKTARKPHLLRDKLVVFLGRITNQKGPQFLLETAEKVSRVYPRIKFIVAGTGDQFAHLLEDSAYRKIGSKFIFTGFLPKEKVNELFSMSDVYFMPSVSEPFGLSALEATQYNVPSVISNQSGASEVLKASLKADFWDTDKFANYIYALLNYNVLAKELSERARNELNSLTWDNAAERIKEVYHEVMR